MTRARRSAGVSISGRVETVYGNIAGRDMKIGLDEEEVVAKLVALLETKDLLRAARQEGMERQTILKLAEPLAKEALDFDQAVKELERAVAIALDVITPATKHDAFVDPVLAQVADQTRAGNFDGSARSIDEGLADIEAAHKRARITLLEEGIKVDMLRRDAASVARRVEAVVAADKEGERPAWLPEFMRRFDKVFEDGQTKGVNFSLSVAIEMARRMLATARGSDERAWAANKLGVTLASLGERESDPSRLEEAVTTYRTALDERTRELVPLDWATTQNGLGNALAILGQRESDPARLEEAATAYGSALEERTRERVPLDWAKTQNNLGNALWNLSVRMSDPTQLEDAVTAYRSALEELVRERVPLDWATTQNNLGNALGSLSQREGDLVLLKEAITAYRAALEERTRERVPLDWATSQNNLGIALRSLGKQETGPNRFEEAITAFRLALEEFTRERVPLDWAMTQNNLGHALASLGECERDPAKLEDAITAYRAALEEWTCERFPLAWAATEQALSNAIAELERLHQA